MNMSSGLKFILIDKNILKYLAKQSKQFYDMIFIFDLLIYIIQSLNEENYTWGGIY